MTNGKALIYVTLCISVLILSSCARPPQESEPAVQIGQPAPNFKLRDLAGRQVSLDQFKGNVVMLDFWATWCGPCRMTMPVMESLQKEYANRMVLLTIDLQEPLDVVRDYVRAHGIHSIVLLDEEGSVGEVYGASPIPMQFLIDKQGIIRHVQMGFEPGMAIPLRSQIDRLP